MTSYNSAIRSPFSEAYDEPGGMLTAGVPIYRLPRELVQAEINAILSMGVELKCNMRLGRGLYDRVTAKRRLQSDLCTSDCKRAGQIDRWCGSASGL